MEQIMIVNASPRAPKSNSKLFAQRFSNCSSLPSRYYPLTHTNHLELCAAMEQFTHVLLVFPLYADAIPVTLLNFLKTLEVHPPQHKPVVSVLINCGFLEPHQNDVALRIIRAFCKRNGYPFGSALKVGSGEAILSTPFQWLVSRRLKQFAHSIANHSYRTLQTTMPLPKRIFIRASTSYWVAYGKKNGVTQAQMQTMQIE